MRTEKAMTDTAQLELPAGDRIPVAYARPPTYDRMIVEKDAAVPMRDGVNLSVDIYRPESDEKFPALLAFSIYNKDLQGPEVAASLPPQPAWSSLWAGLLEAGDTKFFVSRGYAHGSARHGEFSNPMAAAAGSGTATT
jgi:predicted acyl esterase